jgi:uncharacterized protein (TIGR01777 family)
MRILLTGGTGLIGRALCKTWMAQGHDVVIWSRDPKKVASLCSGAQGVVQLSDLPSSKPLDAVVNLAGAPIADQRWTPSRCAVLLQSRVALTHTLVDWLAELAQPPRVLISGSAVGWYGDAQEADLDEDSAPQTPDFGSALCMAWEQEALRAQRLGIRVVLLRTGAVLAAEGGMLARLRLPFSLGLGGRLGNGKQWMPWIHLDDEVGLIDFLLQREDVSGPVNACAPQLVRNIEFTAALAGALHRPAFLAVPAWALRLALGEMSNLLLCGQCVQPRRALTSGYKYKFAGIDAALEQAVGLNHR